ncbi:MAG: hypothetical protein K0Q77_2359 [Anaerosporomusa subterranea]|nr:hypothetical protein [Anaerosporomusa subterranea]
MLEKKQDLTSFLAEYGPGNPEPQQFKDSSKSSRDDLSALQAAEEYIEGKAEQ